MIKIKNKEYILNLDWDFEFNEFHEGIPVCKDGEVELKINKDYTGNIIKRNFFSKKIYGKEYILYILYKDDYRKYKIDKNFYDDIVNRIEIKRQKRYEAENKWKEEVFNSYKIY